MAESFCTPRSQAPLTLLLLALFAGGCAESLSSDGSGSDELSVLRDRLESDDRSGSAADGTDDDLSAEAAEPESTPDDGAPEETPADEVAPPELTDAPAGDGEGDTGGAVPAPESCVDWEPTVLDRAPEFFDERYGIGIMDCDGPAFRRFDARYDVWVGLVSCGTGYRFYLSETAEGPYLPAADGGGHGQDLCELVDPTFSIPIDDDITSGGCSACSIGSNYSFVSGEVFVRYTIGQPFVRDEALSWGPYQSSVITCASGPLECDASGGNF